MVVGLVFALLSLELKLELYIGGSVIIHLEMDHVAFFPSRVYVYVYIYVYTHMSVCNHADSSWNCFLHSPNYYCITLLLYFITTIDVSFTYKWNNLSAKTQRKCQNVTIKTDSITSLLWSTTVGLHNCFQKTSNGPWQLRSVTSPPSGCHGNRGNGITVKTATLQLSPFRNWQTFSSYPSSFTPGRETKWHFSALSNRSFYTQIRSTW